MTDWQSPLDEQLRKASAEWQNLPGEGKPLNLDENPYTPSHLRMAYKVLKENDLAPDWMIEGKALDSDREKLVDRVKNATSINQKLQDEVTALNKRILNYNLKVPAGISHKRIIDINRERNKA